MSKKIKEGILIVASLFALYAFTIGVKDIFHKEKVYLESGRNIYHCSPYCEAIQDMTDYDREMMDESGEKWGSTPVSAKEAYYDITIDMCSYCYSPMDIKHRYDYNMKIYKTTEEYQKAKEKMKEEKIKKFLDKYGK